MTISSKVFKNKGLVVAMIILFALIELVAPHGFYESHEKLESEIEVSLPSRRIRLMRKIKSKLRCIQKQIDQTLKWLHVIFRKIDCDYKTIHYIPIIQIHLISFFQKYHFAMIGSIFHGDLYKSMTLSTC